MILVPIAWSIFNIEIFENEISSVNVEASNSYLQSVILYNGKSDSNVKQLIEQIIRIHYVDADSILEESEWVFQENKNDNLQVVKYRFTPEDITYEIVFLVDPKTKSVVGANTIGEKIINHLELEENSPEYQKILDFHDICFVESESSYSMNDCIKLFQ